MGTQLQDTPRQANGKGTPCHSRAQADLIQGVCPEIETRFKPGFGVNHAMSEEVRRQIPRGRGVEESEAILRAQTGERTR